MSKEDLQDHHIEYLLIDESGDLGKYGSSYFTIIALATHNPKHIGRIIKRIRERKLDKKTRKAVEIKANTSSSRLKKYVLSQLARCECAISAVVLLKSELKDTFYEDKDKLYNYLCGLLFEHISLRTDIIDIVIDKKHSNRLLREDFNQYILSKIQEKSTKIQIRITHMESHASSELQAIDFIAWAVNRKFTHCDSEYYDIIKDKIKNQGKEEVCL